MTSRPSRYDERLSPGEDPSAKASTKRPDRSRSRSSSPEDRRERERRARMARLRAENEEEERKLTALDTESETRQTAKKAPQPKEQIIHVDDAELEGLDEEEQMRKLLGFSGSFESTKGKGVDDNNSSAARGATGKNKARKYRQYMNRKGGFNRPLDKMT